MRGKLLRAALAALRKKKPKADPPKAVRRKAEAEDVRAAAKAEYEPPRNSLSMVRSRLGNSTPKDPFASTFDAKRKKAR